MIIYGLRIGLQQAHQQIQHYIDYILLMGEHSMLMLMEYGFIIMELSLILLLHLCLKLMNQAIYLLMDVN